MKNCIKCGSWQMGLVKTNANRSKDRFHDFMTCQKCGAKHVFIRYEKRK